jgi:hypothetical protein
VNGIATTDLARLSQANTFTNTASFGAGGAPIYLSSTTPAAILDESDGAAGNRRFAIYGTSESFRIAAISDASGVGSDFIVCERTGNTVDSCNIAATSVQANGLHVARAAAALRIVAGGIAGSNGASSGTGITSGSRSGTGQYTVNITAAGFSTTPFCATSALPDDVGDTATMRVSVTSATSVSVQTRKNTTDALADTGFYLLCMGT